MKPKPFLKWAGGKTQLLPELVKHVPSEFGTYYEPFIGGGALLFHLQPRNAVIADVNADLILCYETIKENLDLLISTIDSFPMSSEFYYELRAADREESFSSKPDFWRAARLIYLNKTCFNGLYRVNSKGEFNVPFGKYKNPAIYDFENLVAINSFLSFNDIKIINQGFQLTMSMANNSDFMYLDPPYDVLSETSNFTGYTLEGFARKDQQVVKLCMDSLSGRGVKVLQSNADTPFIRALYADYNIIEVQAKRAINSKADKRGNVTELLIKNY